MNAPSPKLALIPSSRLRLFLLRQLCPLRKKLDEALGRDHSTFPAYEHLEHLPYFNAIIKEGLRIDTQDPHPAKFQLMKRITTGGNFLMGYLERVGVYNALRCGAFP